MPLGYPNSAAPPSCNRGRMATLLQLPTSRRTGCRMQPHNVRVLRPRTKIVNLLTSIPAALVVPSSATSVGSAGRHAYVLNGMKIVLWLERSRSRLETSRKLPYRLRNTPHGFNKWSKTSVIATIARMSAGNSFEDPTNARNATTTSHSTSLSADSAGLGPVTGAKGIDSEEICLTYRMGEGLLALLSVCWTISSFVVVLNVHSLSMSYSSKCVYQVPRRTNTLQIRAHFLKAPALLNALPSTVCRHCSSLP